MKERTLERLEELLDEQEEELRMLKEEKRRLERELRGSPSGWRVDTRRVDDELPVPRLEVACQKISADGFHVFLSLITKARASYQGEVTGLYQQPIAYTHVSGRSDTTGYYVPSGIALDAYFLSGHLGIPVFEIRQGGSPRPLVMPECDFAHTNGVDSRREGK